MNINRIFAFLLSSANPRPNTTLLFHVTQFYKRERLGIKISIFPKLVFGEFKKGSKVYFVLQVNRFKNKEYGVRLFEVHFLEEL